jgi:molecular chaperone HscB
VTIADYFEVFDLPRKLTISLDELQRRFYELSRRYHPDFSMRASPREQAENLDRSALVNRAYRTLRDSISRIEHLIELEEGGRSGLQPKAPVDLLEEILEIQEALTEAKAGGVNETARQRLREERQRLGDRLAAEERALLASAEVWDAATGQNGEREPILNRLKQHLAARAYLTTVINGIDEALGGQLNVSYRRH